jgi:hypothetical protein
MTQRRADQQQRQIARRRDEVRDRASTVQQRDWCSRSLIVARHVEFRKHRKSHAAAVQARPPRSPPHSRRVGEGARRAGGDAG